MEYHHLVAGFFVVDILEVWHDLKGLCGVFGICFEYSFTGIAEPVAVGLAGDNLGFWICLKLFVNVLEISDTEEDLVIHLKMQSQGPQLWLIAVDGGQEEETGFCKEIINFAHYSSTLS